MGAEDQKVRRSEDRGCSKSRRTEIRKEELGKRKEAGIYNLEPGTAEL
jgi:hypothetical protein